MGSKWIYLEGFLFKFRERVSCKPQLEQSLVPETNKIINFISYTEKRRRATTSEESTDQHEQQDLKRGPKHEPSVWWSFKLLVHNIHIHHKSGCQQPGSLAGCWMCQVFLTHVGEHPSGLIIISWCFIDDSNNGLTMPNLKHFDYKKTQVFCN